MFIRQPRMNDPRKLAHTVFTVEIREWLSLRPNYLSPYDRSAVCFVQADENWDHD